MDIHVLGGRAAHHAQRWHLDACAIFRRRQFFWGRYRSDGGQFQIGGEVVLEGMRLNAPCQYLEDLVGIKSLFKALINRSGLNCRIVTGGTIRGGDPIRPV